MWRRRIQKRAVRPSVAAARGMPAGAQGRAARRAQMEGAGVLVVWAGVGDEGGAVAAAARVVRVAAEVVD